MHNKINIYTDGSALGNPGPGGYGIILSWEGKAYTKEISRLHATPPTTVWSC